MKKLYNILSLLLIAFAVGSCTLTMEEFEDPATGSDIPEELRGVDEPYTYNIPGVITATYKYNPGVKPVTTKSKSYLAYVENDTILYFYDNMPKELVPVAGEYLATGCSPELPNGLNNLVLEVTRAGGLYRVFTSRATVDEVYEELNYVLDYTYNPPIAETLEADTITTDSMEYASDEIKMIDDWSLYEAYNNGSLNKINGKTRADAQPKDTTTTWGFKYVLDFKPDGGTDKWNWYQRIFNKAVFNHVKSNSALIPGFEKDFYLEISYRNTTNVRCYSAVNKAEKYEKTYNLTTETNKLGLALGMNYGRKFTLVDKSQDFAVKNKPNNPTEYWDSKKIVESLNALKRQPLQRESMKKLGYTIYIPGTVPVAFVFKFNFDIEFNFNGNVALYRESTTVRKEGYEYNKGEKTPIQDEWEEDPSYSVIGSGSATFALVPTISAGVQFSGSIGADVGVTGRLALLELKAEAGYNPKLKGSIYANATLSSSFTINPFVNFYVSPFGWDLWNHRVDFDTLAIYNTNNTINPKLSISEVPGSLNIDYKGNTKISYAYSVRDLGISLFGGDYEPSVAIFVDDISDDNLHGYGYEPYPTDEPIEKYGYYSFEYEFAKNNQEYDPERKYIAVPALYNPNIEEYLYYTGNGYVLKTPDTKLFIVGGAQEEAIEENGDFNFTDEVGMVKYRFAIDVETVNRELASDFGIYVSIPELGIVEKQISLKRTIYGNGVYTISLSFTSDYVADKQKLNVEISGYTVHGVTGEMNFSEVSGNLELKYPMEYVQHWNPQSKEREDINME